MSTEAPATSSRDLRDRLIPVIAVVVVVAVAVVVFTMLRVARTDGIDALEDAVVSQVSATARSFDARVAGSLQSVAGLGTGWEVTVGSEADLQRLESFALDPDALSGSFLVDTDQRITQGVLLTNADVGERFDPAWWDATAAVVDAVGAAVSPVTASGVTSDLPAYAFVIAVRDAEDPARRLGAIVFEVAVHRDSNFNLEISELATGGGQWYFIDGASTVIASTDPESLGSPVPVAADLVVDAPLVRESGILLAGAPVPSVGWQVVYAEPVSSFEEALSGPLQTAGLVLAGLLALVGLVAVVTLTRRLAAAREEERRIRALASSQEEFISIVSHELRTPVAGVLGFLQTSLDHWETMGDDERLHAVRRAVSNARRLQALTRDVLDAESVEAGRLSFDFQPVDLVTEVEEAQVAAQDLERDREIVLEVPDHPVPVEADPDRLQQVLTNLIDNARNHSPVSVPIELSLEVGDGRAHVRVTDQGAGIDVNTIDTVFDKFVRGRGETVSGTGLGLYICKRIVEAHHGEISVESSEEGTTFAVDLPLAAVPAEPVP